MPKTTKRISFQRTITYTYTADMPLLSATGDADALIIANQPGGVNSLGELLAGSTSANGTISAGSWAVTGTSGNIEPYSIFVPSYAYTVGMRVSPANGGNRLYICRVAGTSGASEPTWDTTIGNDTVSSGATFIAVDKFGTSNTGGVTPSSVRTFANNTAYTKGQIVKPSGGSAQEFVVTAAGTSASTGTPTWPTTVGGSVTSGTATFLLINQ